MKVPVAVHRGSADATTVVSSLIQPDWEGEEEKRERGELLPRRASDGVSNWLSQEGGAGKNPKLKPDPAGGEAATLRE